VQNLINLWSNLSLRNRVITGVASIAVFAAVLGIGRMAATPDMSLLYAGLEPQAAGQVIQALEQKGVPHEVKGGAIYVDRMARDALRMTLAGEGLPANNSKGYELLENLTGFGTTSQMFDAAYWRAKEGELARTILSSPNFSAARVHIAHAGNNPFQRDASPSASVTVSTTGESLPASQVRAIRSLVSSAVAGLRPEDVAVIDSLNGLVSPGDETIAPIKGDDRSEALRERVLRLLEARVGPGNAMVEVNITTDADSETITEKKIDPGSRVAISTESEEQTNTSNTSSNQSVTVASNLPDGDAQTDDGARSSTNQTKERVNYEVSQITREVLRGPGKITRVTVAVLVNELPETQPDGQQLMQARPAQELDALRELVASAVGLDEERGDVVTLKSMAFLQPSSLGTEVSSSFLHALPLDLMSLFQLAVLAVVALILGLFVLRPILSGATNQNIAESDFGQRVSAISSGATETKGLTPLTGEISTGNFFPSGSGEILMPDISPTSGAQEFPIDPVERLRSLIASRQDETVEILRSWLENKGERA
jgi:flagellar M-ring protein FliF